MQDSSICAGRMQLKAAIDALHGSVEVLVHVSSTGIIDARSIDLPSDDSPVGVLYGSHLNGREGEMWIVRLANIKLVEVRDACPLPSLHH